jgi:hypothetical protein
MRVLWLACGSVSEPDPLEKNDEPAAPNKTPIIKAMADCFTFGPPRFSRDGLTRLRSASIIRGHRPRGAT